MKRKYFRIKKAREENRKIAKERIEILKKMIEKDPKGPFVKRYKELIAKITKKYRLNKGF